MHEDQISGSASHPPLAFPDNISARPGTGHRARSTATRTYPCRVAAQVEFWDLGIRQIPYLEAWERQRDLHAEVVAGTAPPTILLLEHEHVYTAGTRTEASDLPPDDEPLVEVDRGGRITWHGPGQLVAYPIVPLRQPLDVVGFVRNLEGALITTCATFGVHGERIPGRSGVWVPVPPRKVAAIGVRVSRGVAMHGVALNVVNDLHSFDQIVPCGIADAGVTSLAAAGANLPEQPMAAVATELAQQLCAMVVAD
jgi:lipoyl(octanoyl) transferase